MFANLFGWRKASKCKKLVKSVKCRLKLLKNKKCCVVNQLKKDVAELLKYGLHQNAFQRVEQLIKDEKTIQVYDLLDQFCEHIIINLPYIRKHKDCPKEINEAASTLIFASARLGEFPELLSIRKIFEERYGQRFVMNAVELLPGNIVSLQMIKKVNTRNVSDDDEKYRILDEIAANCVLSGQYLLEYRPEWLEVQAAKGSDLPVPGKEKTDAKITLVDLQPECKNSWKELSFASTKECYSNIGAMQKLSVNHYETMKGSAIGKSSSEASVRLPNEIICLDDVEEHMLPAYKNEHLEDQRLLMSKSYGMSVNKKTDHGIDNYVKEQELSVEKPALRSTRKTRKGRRKRARRRSMSQESRITTDTECATYYGDSEETSPDSKGRSHYQQREKILASGRSKSFGTKVRNTFNGYQDENETHKSTKINLVTHNGEEEMIQHKLQICTRRTECNEGCEVIKQVTERAMTMPAERRIEDGKDNISRSISFRWVQPDCKYSSSWQPIHPKLPDYDDLAAKFVALRRENLQHKQWRIQDLHQGVRI